jgi:Cdc6-like AAA superfamily ATPase
VPRRGCRCRRCAPAEEISAPEDAAGASAPPEAISPPEAPAADAAQTVPEAPAADAAASGPLNDAQVAAIAKGYAFDGLTLDLGALMNTDPVPSAQIRIPLGMMNRHGLVAGATGTGKTRTLQGLAEQLAAKGVPSSPPI